MILLRPAGSVLIALLPAIALGLAAIPHFHDGLAVDAAVPVPTYMIAQKQMPKAAYDDAQIALRGADSRNGSAMIAGAEAALRGGKPPASQIHALTQGLLRQPASIRGWMLLSEAWSPVNKAKAASAISLAIVLAPHEYWLAGQRVLHAALLWPDLDADTQASALEQTRMLWEEPILHDQLRIVLASKAGVVIATKAFAGRQDEVREMNRWLTYVRSRDSVAK